MSVCKLCNSCVRRPLSPPYQQQPERKHWAREEPFLFSSSFFIRPLASSSHTRARQKFPRHTLPAKKRLRGAEQQPEIVCGAKEGGRGGGGKGQEGATYAHAVSPRPTPVDRKTKALRKLIFELCEDVAAVPQVLPLLLGGQMARVSPPLLPVLCPRAGPGSGGDRGEAEEEGRQEVEEAGRHAGVGGGHQDHEVSYLTFRIIFVSH